MRVQLLQDLQDFFRKKSEIETEYSRNLEKLAERKDQNLLSPVNCWYLLLNQVRRESKDHATLSDLYLNNVISRLTHISEDSARLLKRVSSSPFYPPTPFCCGSRRAGLSPRQKRQRESRRQRDRETKRAPDVDNSVFVSQMKLKYFPALL
ncbi:SLIT-ROBO Rho GTPase-activating protein 1 [Liparis tanakae]|uniref:SLIT-ROBO Rho GTPase-activating protein 1 n=1 Tax=Liparis tanakae TaxID=230148 RepID=A0A4Z2ECB2_9TELE|nr:SLIT-ROBO Rho GTPase-activating protein 1 [Liparis tanakae]